MGIIKKKCHVRKIVILAIHGLLVTRWNWYIYICHILLTYHENYQEKLRKIVILVHFLYLHDDVIMAYHDHKEVEGNDPTKLNLSIFNLTNKS